MTAEFANHFDEITEAVRLERESRMRILVRVNNIARRPEIAAAGNVDQSSGVALTGPFANLHGSVLSPGFVERYPHDNRGVVFQRIHHAFQFEHELCVMLIGPFRVSGIGFESCPGWTVSRTDLILPDHHAQSIAVVVVAARLDFNVLADHVETGGLEELDIK